MNVPRLRETFMPECIAMTGLSTLRAADLLMYFAVLVQTSAVLPIVLSAALSTAPPAVEQETIVIYLALVTR